MVETEHTRTVSEKLFETYLKDRGLTDFDYEPEIEGATKRPDYRVRFGPEEAFFEVKEFDSGDMPLVGGAFDPYSAIREKIRVAGRQLRAVKGRMCGVVVSNPCGALVVLDDMSILGSMQGNVGLTMPFDPAIGALDATRASQTFSGGGKMVRYKGGKRIAAQNTTISALCVLDAVGEGQRRLSLRIARWERETGQQRNFETVWEMVRQAKGTETDASIRRLRLAIYENPDATAPLIEAFGTGSFDERFGVRGGHWIRVFVGSGLEALEQDEEAAGVRREDPFGLRHR